MTSRLLVVALGFALLLIAAVTLPYVWSFGPHLATSQDAWGQFGDYFAGLLNPLFALFAFLALLYSISLQREDARLAAERFKAEYEIAKAELAEYANERVSSELLAVVRDIDSRLSTLLKSIVSKPGTHPELTLAMIVSEGERLRQRGGKSQSYEQFIALANEQGSIVEALVRDMNSLVEQMRAILAKFSDYRGTSQAPLIVYYASKVYGLLAALEDAGKLLPYTRASFASVSDKRH